MSEVVQRDVGLALVAAVAAQFESPLRGGRPLASCISGNHGMWWFVRASDVEAALAQLPPYVAERTVAEEVREVPLP